MNVLATFSSAKYHDTTRAIVESAPGFGVDRVMVYDERWLKDCRPDHWANTRWAWERPDVRGVNFFCFKPHYVADAFRRLNQGDVLLALDADTYPIADLRPIFDQCRKDGGKMFFSAIGCKNRWYTKRDALILMDADNEETLNSDQAVGRFLLLEKGGAFPAEQFLDQWQHFTNDPRINTFDPSKLAPEHEGFIQSRCEQSVLGALTVKYKCKLYREACGFGVGGLEDWDIYPQLFVQEGTHSYAPGAKEEDGSTFRTVFD